MSIEKIAELNKLAAKIEKMKAEAVSVITDQDELRIQALEKIQEYLRGMSDATNGFAWNAYTNTTIFWLVKQREVTNNSGVSFSFGKDNKVDIVQHSYASVLELKDFTNMSRDAFLEQVGDKKRFKEGLVELVERWRDIKPQIEKCAEEALLERMNRAQKSLASFKASYEAVANFEV